MDVAKAFMRRDLGFPHPNAARIDIIHDGTIQLSVLSLSTGGGTFEIVEMDGFAIHFDGQREKWWICCGNNSAAVRDYLVKQGALFTECLMESTRTSCITGLPNSTVLFEVEASTLKKAQKLTLESLSRMSIYLRKAVPVVPAVRRLTSELPFSSAAETLLYAQQHPGVTMPELARLYESALSTLSCAEADGCMSDVFQAMLCSMDPPPENDHVQNIIIPRISEKLGKLKAMPIEMGVLNVCMASALAVMENCCAHRTVVAAPTAGSSGVIPACILGIGHATGRTQQQMLDALWSAGLIGVWIANQATFGAEVAGCQAEIGSAACMAAGGVVQLMGGDIIESMSAAAIALQSFLGLICDPVGGLTEIPCIERNVTACAVSVMSANMALCGIRSPIPLDETIQAMLHVGQMLPRELRCTCGGGLCITPTGINIAKKVKELLQE